MAKLNFYKISGNTLSAIEFMQLATTVDAHDGSITGLTQSVSTIQSEVSGKATVLSTQQMDGDYFTNVGTVSNPIIRINGTGIGFISALKSAWSTFAGYDATNTNLFTNTAFNWVAGGGSSQPQLSSPVLSFATSTTSQNVINWTAPTNATGYVLQRADDSGYTLNLVSIYTGSLLTFTDTGRAAGTTYYYRVKATGTGYADSPYATGNKTTAAAGDVTAPVVSSGVVQDSLRTRIVLNMSEGMVIGTTVATDFTVSGGKTVTSVTVSGSIINLNLNSGYVIGDVISVNYTQGVGKLQDASGNLLLTFSYPSVTNSILIDPPAPTSFSINDVDNTASFVNAVGYVATDHEYRWRTGGVYTAFTSATSNIISVGNFIVIIGDMEIRVKAAAGSRNASAVLTNSTAFTLLPNAPTNLILNDSTKTATWTLSSSPSVVATDHEYRWRTGGVYTAWTTASTNSVNVGNISVAIGDFEVKVKVGTNRLESSVVLSTTAFIAAASDVTTPLIFPLFDGVYQGELTNTNFYVASTTNGYTRLSSDSKIGAGGTGYFQSDLSGTEHSNSIALNAGFNIAQNHSGYLIRMYRHHTNNKIYVVNSGIFIGEVVQAGGTGVRMRLRCDGTNIYAEYTINSGTSWTQLGTPVAQGAAELYCKIWGDLFPARNANLVAYNLIANNPVPAAPTNLVVNNTTKAITWSNATGMFNADTEIRYKLTTATYFTNWTVHGSVTFDSTAKEIAIGDFQVRTKAIDSPIRNYSEMITNSVLITG